MYKDLQSNILIWGTWILLKVDNKLSVTLVWLNGWAINTDNSGRPENLYLEFVKCEMSPRNSAIAWMKYLTLFPHWTPRQRCRGLCRWPSRRSRPGRTGSRCWRTRASGQCSPALWSQGCRGGQGKPRGWVPRNNLIQKGEQMWI